MNARIRSYGINKLSRELVFPHNTHQANAGEFGLGNARTQSMNAQGWYDLARGVGNLGNTALGIATEDRRREAIEQEKLRREQEAEMKKMEAQTKAMQRRERNLQLMQMNFDMVKGMKQELDGSNTAVSGSTGAGNNGSSDIVNTIAQGAALSSGTQSPAAGSTGNADIQAQNGYELQTVKIEKMFQKKMDWVDSLNLSEDEAYPLKMNLYKWRQDNYSKAFDQDKAYQAKRKVEIIEGALAVDSEDIYRVYDDDEKRDTLMQKLELKVATIIGQHEKDPNIARQRFEAYMGGVHGSIIQKFSNESDYQRALDYLHKHRSEMPDMSAEEMETKLEKNIKLQQQNELVLKEAQAEAEIMQQASDPELINNPQLQFELLNSIPVDKRENALKIIKQNEALAKKHEELQDQEIAAAYTRQTIEKGEALPYLEIERQRDDLPYSASETIRVPVDTDLLKAEIESDNIRDQANPETRARYNKFMDASDEVKANVVLGKQERIAYGREWFDKMVQEKAEAKKRVQTLRADNDAFKKTLPTMAVNYAKSIFKSFAESKNMPGEEVIIMNNFLNMARHSDTKDETSLRALADSQLKYAEFDSNTMHLFGYDHGYTYQIMSGDPDSPLWQEMEDEPDIPSGALRKFGGKMPKGSAWDGVQRIWRLPNGKCIDMFGNIGRAPKVNKHIYRQGPKYLESISDFGEVRDDRENALPSNVLWSAKEQAYVGGEMNVMYDENGKQLKVE